MKRSNLLVVYLLCLLIFSGCAALNVPPSVNATEQRLHDNYSDIKVVVDFMLKSDNETIYIDASDRMYADLEWTDINNQNIIEAIERLLRRNVYKSISKKGENIIFLQWVGVQDIGCGIVYSNAFVDDSVIPYLTELKPLSINGWYYFIDDYELWRTGVKSSA